MRIAIFTNQFPTLSETFIVNKVKGLLKVGIDLTIIVNGRSNINRHSYPTDFLSKIRIVNINDKKVLIKAILSNPIIFLFLLKEVKKINGVRNFLKVLKNVIIVKHLRLDILHFEFSGLAISFLEELDYLGSTKIFVSCRGSAENVKPILEHRRAEELNLLFRKADRIHCVSEAISNEIKKYGADEAKIFINRPAIDLSEWSMVKRNYSFSDKIIILSVGRLTFQKGYTYAISAIYDLKNEYSNLEYIIVGDGPARDELIFLLNKRNLQKNVKVLGALSNEEIKGLVVNSDIFILPSITEGIANSVIEAMASGLPVISTNVGGMNELIGQNEGILVEPFNSDDLKYAIIKLINDEELRKEIARNAFKKVCDSFQLDRQINVYITEYKQCCSNF